MARIPTLRPVSHTDEIVVQKKVPELLRVPCERPVIGIALCNTLFALPTHYNGERTSICTGPEECKECGHRALRVYYLLALYDRNTAITAWFQLPDRAAHSLLEQLRQAEKALYGSILQLSRERKTMKAPVRVALDVYSAVSGRLPKPMDPTETLERVFSEKKTTRKKATKAL